MSSVWSRIQGLKGKALATEKQGKTFHIVSVDSRKVEFMPDNGTGTPRSCTRQGIEEMYEVRAEGRALTRSQVQALWPNDYNSSYIAAIVNAVYEG